MTVEVSEDRTFLIFKRLEVEERHHVLGTVEVLIRVPRAVEDANRVLGSPVEQLAPAHQANLPVALKVDVVDRTLGGKLVVDVELVKFINQGL